jgi:hypothetical protein
VFTLFGHLLPLLGFLVGSLGGASAGFKAGGVVSAVVGAAAGGIFGLVCGFLPAAMMRTIVSVQLRRKSSDDLHSGECPLVNLATLELRSRGEDGEQHLDFVLDLLVSTHHSDRCRGWAAMLTAYPELTIEIGDYIPVNQMSEIQVARFREEFRQTHQRDIGIR